MTDLQLDIDILAIAKGEKRRQGKETLLINQVEQIIYQNIH